MLIISGFNYSIGRYPSYCYANDKSAAHKTDQSTSWTKIKEEDDGTQQSKCNSIYDNLLPTFGKCKCQSARPNVHITLSTLISPKFKY